jgi:hypothetical protein
MNQEDLHPGILEIVDVKSKISSITDDLACGVEHARAIDRILAVDHVADRELAQLSHGVIRRRRKIVVSQ